MTSPLKEFIYNSFATRFWFKGKGILVPVLYFLTMFLVAGIYYLIEPYQWIPDKGPLTNAVMGGSMLIIGGFATWFVGRDFIRIDGKRVEIDLGNIFLLFKMKTFGIISIVLGILLFCWQMVVFFIGNTSV